MAAKGIKTRQVIKDIRAIDKAATAAERFKSATIKTKDEAISTQQPKENSASEYASDTTMDTLHGVAVEVRHQAVKQGGKSVDAVRKRAHSFEELTVGEDAPFESAETPYGTAYRSIESEYQPTDHHADIKTRDHVSTDGTSTENPLIRTRSASGEKVSQPAGFQEQGRKKAVEDTKIKIRERQRVELREQVQHRAEIQSTPQIKTRANVVSTSHKVPDTSSASAVPMPTRIKNRTNRKAAATVKSTASSVLPGKPRIRNVKEASQTIKTGALTAQTAIKTAERTAAASKAMTLKNTVEAAKSAQISRRSAEKAQQLAKTVANSIAKAARAIAEAARSLMAALVAGGSVTVFLAVIICLFGVVICLFCGDGANSTAELSISEEVYAYQGEIADAAERYGIAEYIQLIEAVMMQESGGVGTDPMQASECGYNTRFPRTPGSITDPLYSIDCGVHELADCLAAASVESPSDIERIRLALQGYNYGSGYISWALRNYDGYTFENAAEFSDMKKSQLGTTVYGDPEYAPHVLRYYSYNYLMSGNMIGSQMMIAVAGNEIGYREKANSYTKYGAWYGIPNGDWCAMFVSWCAEQCNYISTGICPKLAYVPDMVTWFQSKNQWYDNTITPPIGAYIIFDWEGDGTADHIGMVEYIQDDRVHTIEGNSGNMVKRNSYTIASKLILGYGIPMYW